MLNHKKISLIIPCKNEQAALYSMLKKVPSFIDEVIVVDNNSTDNTPVVAILNGAKLIHEKRHVGGIGYGFAHQTGMKNASGDYIVSMDGDDTYPLESIQDIILYMEKSGSDFVSGSRFPLTNPDAISFMRKLGVHILNLEATLLYGYQMQDILSGMWVMKKECMKKLQAKTGGWDFSAEIKLAAITNPAIHFSEYHIPHATRINGISKLSVWQTGFAYFRYILQRRFTVDKKITRQQVRFFTNNIHYAFRSITATFL